MTVKWKFVDEYYGVAQGLADQMMNDSAYELFTSDCEIEILEPESIQGIYEVIVYEETILPLSKQD